MLNEISVVNNDIESSFVEIELSDMKKIYVGVIYRTPGADVRNFCDYSVDIHTQPCYLTGDSHMLKQSAQNPTSEFLDLMFSDSFIPLMNKPTRTTLKAETIFDNIFDNKYKIKKINA